MPQFTITITDKAKLLGITAAREAHNASLPDVPTGEVDGDGAPVMGPNPAILATDQAYLQFIMDRAAESYAKQHSTDEAAIDAQIVELQDRKAALAGAFAVGVQAVK